MAENSHLWKPGQSGNPAGRRKSDDGEIKELARSYTKDAVETLARICKDVNAPPSAQVAAANGILDRAFGRPAQAVSVSAENSHEQWLAALGLADTGNEGEDSARH